MSPLQEPKFRQQTQLTQEEQMSPLQELKFLQQTQLTQEEQMEPLQELKFLRQTQLTQEAQMSLLQELKFLQRTQLIQEAQMPPLQDLKFLRQTQLIQEAQMLPLQEPKFLYQRYLVVCMVRLPIKPTILGQGGPMVCITEQVTPTAGNNPISTTGSINIDNGALTYIPVAGGFTRNGITHVNDSPVFNINVAAEYTINVQLRVTAGGVNERGMYWVICRSNKNKPANNNTKQLRQINGIKSMASNQ